MTLIVIGAGGYARGVIEVLRASNIPISGITDSAQELWGQMVSDLPVLGNDEVLLTLDPATTALTNGLGNTATRHGPGLDVRANVFERFLKLGYAFPAVRHPSTTIASNAVLSVGCQIMAGAIIQAGTVIGQNVIVNLGVVIDHDCIISDHVHIAPGAVLCGNVKVGARSHIGAGAIIIQNVTVGSGVVIAAGAIVTRDTEDNVLIKR